MRLALRAVCERVVAGGESALCVSRLPCDLPRRRRIFLRMKEQPPTVLRSLQEARSDREAELRTITRTETHMAQENSLRTHDAKKHNARIRENTGVDTTLSCSRKNLLISPALTFTYRRHRPSPLDGRCGHSSASHCASHARLSSITTPRQNIQTRRMCAWRPLVRSSAMEDPAGGSCRGSFSEQCQLCCCWFLQLSIHNLEPLVSRPV